MKITLFPLLVLVLAGCQTPPTFPRELRRPAPEPRALADAPAPLQPNAALALKLRQQVQLVEALMSQNDALVAQLKAAGQRPAESLAEPAGPSPTQLPALPRNVAPAPTPPAEERLALLLPNADGLIDVTAVASGPTDGESANPFAVRTPSSAPARETTLAVQGIMRGARPCAMVNDRPLEIGEAVDTLRLVRIEPDGLVFAAGEFFLKIPLGGKPVRVRHT